MFTIPWLVAVAVFCDGNHEGQASRLYRIGCLARMRLRKYHQITDPYAWFDSKAISRAYKNRFIVILDQLEMKHQENYCG